MPRLDDEAVARIRAAISYAELSQEELAARLGFSRHTLARRLQEDMSAYERDAFIAHVAAACGLPVQFFSVDFRQLDQLSASPELLIRQLTEINERLAALEAARQEARQNRVPLVETIGEVRSGLRAVDEFMRAHADRVETRLNVSEADQLRGGRIYGSVQDLATEVSGLRERLIGEISGLRDALSAVLAEEGVRDAEEAAAEARGSSLPRDERTSGASDPPA